MLFKSTYASFAKSINAYIISAIRTGLIPNKAALTTFDSLNLLNNLFIIVINIKDVVITPKVAIYFLLFHLLYIQQMLLNL